MRSFPTSTTTTTTTKRTAYGRQRPDKPSLSRAANPNRGRGRPISIVPRCAKTMLSMQCLCVHACMQYSYSYSTPTVQASHAGEKEKQVAAKPAFSPQVVLSIVSARSLCALQRLPSGSGHPSDRTSTSFRLWISNHACSGRAHPATHTASPDDHL